MPLLHVLHSYQSFSSGLDGDLSPWSVACSRKGFPLIINDVALLTAVEVERLISLGFCQPRLSLCKEDIESLESIFEALPGGPGTRMLPSKLNLPFQGQLDEIAAEALGEQAVAVRAIFFSKPVEQNWLVPWHQDVTLATPEKRDIDGFDTWTEKDGIWHVQPPDSVLRRMVAIRVHLDDCGAVDGPLRVIERSHSSGRLSSDEVDTAAREGQSQTLLARQGEMILMYPLVVHSSSKATGTSRRRVLHMEYCAAAVYPFTT